MNGKTARARLFLMSIAIAVGAEGARGSDMDTHGNLEFAVLGGGCFWCLEAVYELVPGVVETVSGYAGGKARNPTYEQVCTGATGHAEVIKITFDPAVVSYSKLLDTFWKIHDPTALNRQGADIGTQYRSIILYKGETQKKAAEASIKAISASYPQPIMTELKPLAEFWEAEAYHQDYFRKNPDSAYCRISIPPKIKKAGF